MYPNMRLFPFSAARYRHIWDAILYALGIEKGVFTPGGLRGGGAVASYFAGAPIADIQWSMRLASQDTLRFYLQEVAAESSLSALSDVARQRVRAASKFYTFLLKAAPDLEAARCGASL